MKSRGNPKTSSTDPDTHMMSSGCLWWALISSVWLHLHTGSPFLVEMTLWLHYTHLDNPGYCPYLKVRWLATLIPSAAFIPLYHLTWRTDSFWGLGHLWGAITLPTAGGIHAEEGPQNSHYCLTAGLETRLGWGGAGKWKERELTFNWTHTTCQMLFLELYIHYCLLLMTTLLSSWPY